MVDSQERVHEVAQTALRQEAALRAQLKDQLKARDASKKSKAMKPGRARAVKRSEDHLATSYTTGSGKRQKTLPVQGGKMVSFKQEPATPARYKTEAQQETKAQLDATFSIADKDAATLSEGNELIVSEFFPRKA